MEAVELPLEEQIEWAITEWRKSGQWPLLADKIKFVLHARFAAAADFAHSHIIDDKLTNLLPLPDLPPRETCHWLVTTWWQAHGRELWAVLEKQRYSEED